MRYDWLAQNLFGSLDEVQLGATAWLWTYNNERPDMALGGITPKQKLASKYLTDSTAAYGAFNRSVQHLNLFIE